MAKAALLSTALPELFTHASNLAINVFDKAGFDLDTTGRKRHVLWMEEQTKAAYNRQGMGVNIAIWNMHIDEEDHFNSILDSGLCKMGNGGGFRIVVFRGGGYLKNKGGRGFENWCCSGKQSQNDNVITFEAW
ncbi:hypothetical protein K443DRAFT_684591 [Laccaria amethystina LaAM-08-1]|uniref:Uncharacterized protein n=1 Tax=Laccaria amethystina LaAM-08-1 TaxID=1095629 RepID=A0A0C9WX39_9AGAR|nr:hypothetical protein K443DRAFT_684591 [Laccaria amethystina LaAM-08-1]